MNRSTSSREFARPTRSPQQRSIYINQESTKRDTSTPFHSPYKDGKPNPHYTNPSFVSNHLFYPQQMYQPGQSKYRITTNLIPNCNDRKKDELFRERIKRQVSVSALNKSQKTRQYTNNQGSRTRILRANQPQTLLKHELDILQQYRQISQRKNERWLQISRKRNEEAEYPIYLQKHRLTPVKYDPPRQSKQDQNLQDLTRELRALKKQMKHSDNSYDQNIDRIIIQNKQLLIKEQQQHRRQSTMLGNILREQMKLSKPLKERKWNY